MNAIAFSKYCKDCSCHLDSQGRCQCVDKDQPATNRLIARDVELRDLMDECDRMMDEQASESRSRAYSRWTGYLKESRAIRSELTRRHDINPQANGDIAHYMTSVFSR